MRQILMYALATLVVLLAGACSALTSTRQLSPDREPAAPRHILAADSMAPPDSVK